jgi:hypothetical protein
LINKRLEGNKKGQKTIKNLLPRYGSFLGQISNQFVAQLSLLATFPEKMREFESFGKQPSEKHRTTQKKAKKRKRI